uniref:Alkaline phosphatase n=1 Tax=Glossina pallidipes TaxID=7398 RepID=A0A1B0AJT9_GLOPL
MFYLIYFCVVSIILHCAKAATTSFPPPIIRTLDTTSQVGPEFKTLDPTAPVDEATRKLAKANEDKKVEDSKFWFNVGLKQLEKIVNVAKNNDDNSYKKKAKNIIIFVGDGMGVTTITAGRIYKGQYLKHGLGEEEKLSFDEFPYTALVKTYNVDKQVPDSAGTATAMFCGSKAHFGAIGMDATRSPNNSTQGRLTSIMDWAQKENKRTGIVTTTRITHATPAATYARIYHRDWECDSKIPEQSKDHYIDIARQLVETSPGNKFNVVLGGGLQPLGAMNPMEKRTTPWEGGTEKVCSRNDTLNLPEMWLKMGQEINDERAFVSTQEELKQLDLKKINSLMGLFRNNHMTYAIAKEEGEPSLKEMTEAAIDVLERGNKSKGYVLLVEGGRIDQGHHQNYARAALHEVYEFDMAIQAALERTNENETLILVTADHSHAVTLNGYPARGNDILGFANKPGQDPIYETLTYANGPGFKDHLNLSATTENIWITNFTEEQRQSSTYRHLATLPLPDETHGGEDVALFAHGPGSSLVRGVFEQNYIAFVMSYAGCMGPAKDFDNSCQHRSSAGSLSMSLLLFAAVSFIPYIHIFDN